MTKQEKKLDQSFRNWETLEDVDSYYQELEAVKMAEKEARKERHYEAKMV